MVDGTQLVTDTGLSLQNAALALWESVIEVIPGLIAAAIIIIIGWFIGKIAKAIVIKVLQSTRIDQWVDEQNLTAAIGGKEISVLCGSLIKWYIIIVFLAQAVGLINLEVLKEFAQLLVDYIPKVLGAIILVVGGLLLGRYAKNAIEATQHRLKRIASNLVEAIVIIFTAVMALTLVIGEAKVQILIELLNIFITPFIWAIAIATGVVFGLFIAIGFKSEFLKMAQEVKKGIKK